MMALFMKPKILMGIALAGLLAFAAWHYTSLRSERDHLLIENSALVSSLEAQRKLTEANRIAFKAALAAQADAEDRARDLSNRREEVLRAPESDDGPIAPVLRGALDSLLTDGGED